MKQNQKTLKTLIEDFNLLLEINLKKNSGVLQKKHHKCHYLEELTDSDNLMFVEKRQDSIGSVFFNFLLEETEFRPNFDIYPFLNNKNFDENVLDLNFTTFKEEIYNFEPRNFFYNFQKFVTLKCNFVEVPVNYISDTQTVKCISSLELHEDFKIYEDLTLEEILKSFIEDCRKIVEQKIKNEKELKEKEEEHKKNMIILNRIIFVRNTIKKIKTNISYVLTLFIKGLPTV